MKIRLYHTQQHDKLCPPLQVRGSCDWRASHVAAYLIYADPYHEIMQLGQHAGYANVTFPFDCRAAIRVPGTYIPYSRSDYDNYRIIIREANVHGDSVFNIQLKVGNVQETWSFIDIWPQAPVYAKFNGDTDGRARRLGGDIMVGPPENAFGLTSYRAYWARAQSATHLIIIDEDQPIAEAHLPIVCPPRNGNADQHNFDSYTGMPTNMYADILCWNPVAPKCIGDCKKYNTGRSSSLAGVLKTINSSRTWSWSSQCRGRFPRINVSQHPSASSCPRGHHHTTHCTLRVEIISLCCWWLLQGGRRGVVVLVQPP